MTEIESKARQLAQVKTAPAGSYDVCKQAIALEMAEWMKERIIEKVCKYLEEHAGDYMTLENDEEGELQSVFYQKGLIEDLRKAMED